MMDFAPWDRMLQDYVSDRGQVDYARWQQNDQQTLAQWLLAQQAVDWQELEPDAAIALLINLYNALTIQQVLARYPLTSIRPSLGGIPNWWAWWRFFTRTVYTLNGVALSLNTIEHRWLRAQLAEPRIHFALVCASVGCPLLRSQAYQPHRLAAQLDADAQRFIHNPAKVRYDSASQSLACSKIFQWYRADFLTVAPSIPAYIHRYCPDVPPEGVIVRYLPYSWQLNQLDQRTSS